MESSANANKSSPTDMFFDTRVPSHETAKMPSMNAHQRTAYAQLRRCKELGCTNSSTTLGACYCHTHAHGKHAQGTLHQILNGNAEKKNVPDLDTARPLLDVLRKGPSAYPDVALCKLEKDEHEAEIRDTLKAAIRDASQHQGGATAWSPSGEGAAAGSSSGKGAALSRQRREGVVAGSPSRERATAGDPPREGATAWSPPGGGAIIRNPLGEGATAGSLHARDAVAGNPLVGRVEGRSPYGEGAVAWSPPGVGVAAGSPTHNGEFMMLSETDVAKVRHALSSTASGGAILAQSEFTGTYRSA